MRLGGRERKRKGGFGLLPIETPTLGIVHVVCLGFGEGAALATATAVRRRRTSLSLFVRLSRYESNVYKRRAVAVRPV